MSIFPRLRRAQHSRCAGAILLALLPLAAAAAPGAPGALASVGRLLIPTLRLENGYRRHYDERCSATLVGVHGQRRSRWILSAWHCLEYYRDLSRPIVFEHGSGARLQARAVTSGGDMHADWVLLRLERPLPAPVAPDAADVPARAPLLMAGYSRSAAGTPGNTLSWDNSCQVIGRDGADLRSDCRVRRGASGGAVFRRGGGSAAYIGIISRGDGASESIFVPLRRILPRISPYLTGTP